MGTFKFLESVWYFVVFVGSSIIGHIQIPPGAVIVDTVPSVVSGAVVRSSVHHIARDVLTPAEGSEEIGEIVAAAFAGAQCFTDIEILDECEVIIVVLKVINDPSVDRLHLFGIGITA